jgi:hypothetical protein
MNYPLPFCHGTCCYNDFCTGKVFVCYPVWKDSDECAVCFIGATEITPFRLAVSMLKTKVYLQQEESRLTVHC